MWRYLIDGQSDPVEGVRLRAFWFGWLFDLDLKNAPRVPYWKLPAGETGIVVHAISVFGPLHTHH